MYKPVIGCFGTGGGSRLKQWMRVETTIVREKRMEKDQTVALRNFKYNKVRESNLWNNSQIYLKTNNLYYQLKHCLWVISRFVRR